MSNFKTRKIPHAKNKDSEENKKNEKTGKKSKKILGFFLLFLSIALLINMGIQAMGNIKIGGNNFTFMPISFSGAEEKFIKGTTNVLIAGIGGQGHEGGNLTDSLMLASINPETKYVTLLSIPRDLFVAYPKGYGTAGRINALYGMGKANGEGINLLAQKVSEITGQPIHHYAVIDFRGFKNVIDTLGGIEIDVPKDLVDREYPDENWGYETFVVRAGLQTFDGEKALKYVRSRHSTSDFDRSERQQLVIKAIRDKALSAGVVTSPSKIGELYNAVIKNIDTDFTLGDITKYALGLKDIENDHINIYNLSNDCSGIKCSPGAYLYSPAREYFGGAAAIIPENASATRLSYYDDIRRFVEFVFLFPNLKNEKIPLVFVTKKGGTAHAKSVIIALEKMGFQFDTNNVIVESTGAISASHINIYWNEELQIGTNPESNAIKALKKIEEKIPYTIVQRNEYVNNAGPKIEVVLGDDKNSYFQFAKPAYYLPYIETKTSTGSSGGSLPSSQTTSGEGQANKKSGNTGTSTKTLPKPASSSPKNITNPEDPYKVRPGEWENF